MCETEPSERRVRRRERGRTGIGTDRELLELQLLLLNEEDEEERRVLIRGLCRVSREV